jgi:transposase
MTRQTQSNSLTYRYSEAFKQKIVNEIENGNHSIYSAKEAYGIKGDGTIYYWIKKMGKLELLNKIVRIEMPQEKDQLKELKAQIKELKEALIQTQLKELRADCDLEVAMEMLGYKDKEEFKKKLEQYQSKKR